MSKLCLLSNGASGVWPNVTWLGRKNSIHIICHCHIHLKIRRLKSSLCYTCSFACLLTESTASEMPVRFKALFSCLGPFVFQVTNSNLAELFNISLPTQLIIITISRKLYLKKKWSQGQAFKLENTKIKIPCAAFLWLAWTYAL